MLSLKKVLTQGTEEKIAGLERRVEDERRRNDDELTLLKQQIVRVSKGGALSAEAILDGRLFNEVAPSNLTDFVSDTDSLVIIDVRTDSEWAGGRIPGAKHIPIDQLARRIDELGDAKSKPILAYCAAGGRSAAACDLLSQNGFMTLFNAAGGIGAYKGNLDR